MIRWQIVNNGMSLQKTMTKLQVLRVQKHLEIFFSEEKSNRYLRA